MSGSAEERATTLTPPSAQRLVACRDMPPPPHLNGEERDLYLARKDAKRCAPLDLTYE